MYKNSIKELYKKSSIKIQESSKEENRRQHFKKALLFRTRGNRGREILAADKTLQQQYSTGRLGRPKNEFINSAFYQLDEYSVSIIVFQNTCTSSEFISVKCQATAQCRQNETFWKEMAKINKRFYNAGCNKKLCQLLTKLTKFVSINQRNNRPGGSGGQEHVEERCYSSFRSQRGSVSQLVVCCEKGRWRNWPIVNLNDLNTNIPY